MTGSILPIAAPVALVWLKMKQWGPAGERQGWSECWGAQGGGLRRRSRKPLQEEGSHALRRLEMHRENAQGGTRVEAAGGESLTVEKKTYFRQTGAGPAA